ncbi:hypothetical protein D6C90_09059 [Aureobasidium pullulans]|uniref:Uncharacterized protein n=1 Tax=Aureobasidium pullulans TaxID=5580 RepID=A0A4S9DLV9_AURPU|nr:hypothetical protein D6D12_10155 [Aureobasidium pullulans]THX57336.1 hypothetical protein D6D11_03214 [Aureobasidium pullulans]THZ26680.1 hypothetical protein D6C90_09059 [Aureobasidium pullulans]
MAEIHGLREQILANYGFMGYEKPTSEVDVVVRYLDDRYYRASLADKSSGENICEEDREAKTVKDALAHLLSHTCAYLGRPPNMLGTGSTQQPTSPAAKKTRGRPKSILPSTAATPVKPAVKSNAKKGAVAVKTKVATPIVPAKRGRGRPRKSEVQQPAVASVARPRGRPRKNPAPVEIAGPDVLNAATIAPMKRGRGRPRKSIATPVATTGSKRSASALGDEKPETNKSRKTITDEETQDRVSADELGDEAGLAAPFTPQVWFPTYVSRIARVVYHCIHGGPEGGLTEEEIARRTTLRLEDVIAGIREMSEKSGIVGTPDTAGELKWALLDEWDDEDE